ncbi:PREDICTED: proton-coupled folate transporter-like [Rhagoletis zephyria]|uniref:proton-coupled folate transporter-like n=1 Tax=Rhagoletis zephyria TaxID=28612 RepID=UPI0008115837|nr:PREDICTED: proton-coupled folate transporter-like [Rhagoletis zephyria]
MVSPIVSDEDEKHMMQTRGSIEMSFEPVTFDEEGNIAAPVYLPTTTSEKGLPDGCSPEEPLSPQSKRSRRRRIMSLELPVFLLLLGIMLTGPVMLNQELYQTCVAVYHYNESDCEPLRGIIPKTEEAKIIENHLQPYVAKITMTNSILHNVWPGILVLFVGPWSDKFGRRPVLLMAFTASFIGHVITTILVSISKLVSLNPWLYLIGSIPSTLAGGGSTVMTIVICYVSDVADMENKAKRMFYVDLAMGTGLVFGNVLSSYLLRLTGVTMVCVTSALLILIGLLYVFFFIGESLDVEKTSFSHKAKRFFDILLIKDLVKTCVARRPNYGRAIIGCTISILMVSSFVHHGEHGVFYLFLRNKFNVTLQQYTYFNATQITIKMVGCSIAVTVLRKIFKIPFGIIALMGLAGHMLECLTRALAQSFWQMYVASSFGILSGITTPMLQAIISLAVPSNEIGKVYSLAACLQTLSPLIAAPLYTFVYSHTLQTFPSFFNFISSGLYGECFVVMIVISIFERRVANRPSQAEEEKGQKTKKSLSEEPKLEKLLENNV